MSNFSTLEIGKSGLLASRYGLDITSNNITNVNTPGYSRQTAVVTESDPVQTSNGFVGTGAVVEKLRSYREDYFDNEIRKNLSLQNGYESDANAMQGVESYIAEPSDLGLNETVANFLNSFQDLSLSPENLSMRDTVVSSAQTLVDQFHSISQQLSDARDQAGSSISTDIDKINQMVKDISDLNGKIATSAATNGTDAQTLVDQRATQLEDLSKIVGINVTQSKTGAANVFINGTNIITESTFSKLTATKNIDKDTGEQTISLVKTDPNGNSQNAIVPQTGEIASLLKQYNVTLDNLDSSGGYSIASKIDEFAGLIANKVNDLSVTGYGLNDTGTNPPGRNFFDPQNGNITAANIEISSDIKDHPENIPIADTPSEPGNAEVALKLGQIASDQTFSNGQTPSDYYTEIIGKIGTMGQEANTGSSTTKLVTDQLTSQRDSLIGVNLDEESINLIKFQKAFEACARIITVTDEMLKTVINLGV
jgi:flagellar hook-associated protein 1 FlgK